MRFDGTHTIGEHRITLPVPPQIALPERKIIAATEAAAWHETRGHGVAAQSVTHPLLTGLASGWEYTSGSQQTLDSSGVIANGPCDTTPVPNSGSPSYNASGALIDGYFDFNDTGGIIGAGKTDPWFIMFECNPAVEDSALFQAIAPVFGNPYGLGVQSVPVSTWQPFSSLQNDSGGLGTCGPTPDAAYPFTLNQNNIIFGWYDPSIPGLSVQVNNGTVSTLNLDTQFGGSGWALTAGPVDLQITPPTSGRIRRARIWIGANALVIASTYRSTLYNSGNGISDAVLAATT